MAKRSGRKVIITCAVTGSIHTPTMSPHLPVTSEQILESAVGAAEAGAAILHLHARNSSDGRPSPSPEAFLEFLPALRDRTDAVINITTGGGQNMTVRERMQAALRLQPEMCSLNMGSMNFGLFPMLNRYPEWQHEWEPEYLERSRDFIFKNTFQDIETLLKEVGEGCGVRFEFECYDVGHLYSLAHFVDRGLVKPPFFVQTIFGVLGGIGPEPDHLLHMRRTADQLFGDAYQWSILGAGRHQMNLVTMGAILGGHVRVGLEDSLYIGPGRLAESNAQQVTRIRTILEALSLEVATPDEARSLLQLKGRDRIGF